MERVIWRCCGCCEPVQEQIGQVLAKIWALKAWLNQPIIRQVQLQVQVINFQLLGYQLVSQSVTSYRAGQISIQPNIFTYNDETRRKNSTITAYKNYIYVNQRLKKVPSLTTLYTNEECQRRGNWVWTTCQELSLIHIWRCRRRG